MLEIVRLAEHALVITGFVAGMMLAVEYLNVLTRGAWQEKLLRWQWGQYLLGAALGATPGCLGALMVVTMYSHRVITIGTVVTTMIATTGDEMFVMLGLIPETTGVLIALLVPLGILSGALVDMVLARRRARDPICQQTFEIHTEHCECFPRGRILSQLRHCIPARGLLLVFLGFFIIGLLAGDIGGQAWDWKRATLLGVSAFGMWVVGTVPDHFVQEHLWAHVARKHVPRIFLWTFGAFVAVWLLTQQLDIKDFVQEHKTLALLIAGAVGIIPESGPHLAFVTLYADGTLPFSVLVTSSIIQDGHGMLPLLATSRRTFFGVKAVKLVVGLTMGLVLLLLGW